jgi:hypothetical protein
MRLLQPRNTVREGGARPFLSSPLRPAIFLPEHIGPLPDAGLEILLRVGHGCSSGTNEREARERPPGGFYAEALGPILRTGVSRGRPVAAAVPASDVPAKRARWRWPIA